MTLLNFSKTIKDTY